MKNNFDETDLRILAELDLNARATDSEIAIKLGMTSNRVKYRIDNLEGSGVIKGYDPESKGFKHWQDWSGLNTPISGSIALHMADGARLMVNGLEAGLRGELLYRKIMEISGSPGGPFFVDDLIPLKNLNYKGASGPIDHYETGELEGEISLGWFTIWIGAGTGDIFEVQI
jgi:hypothetical protein